MATISADTNRDPPPKSAATVVDLFLKTIGQDAVGFADVIEREPVAEDKRPLGADFVE